MRGSFLLICWFVCAHPVASASGIPPAVLIDADEHLNLLAAAMAQACLPPLPASQVAPALGDQQWPVDAAQFYAAPPPHLASSPLHNLRNLLRAHQHSARILQYQVSPPASVIYVRACVRVCVCVSVTCLVLCAVPDLDRVGAV